MQKIAKVLEKGPDKVFDVVAAFIPHPCYDSVSGKGWFGGEKPRGNRAKCCRWQVFAQTKVKGLGSACLD